MNHQKGGGRDSGVQITTRTAPKAGLEAAMSIGDKKEQRSNIQESVRCRATRAGEKETKISGG